MGKLVSSAGLLVLIRVLGIGIQAPVVIWLARTLPIVEMGVFSVAYAYLGLVRYLGPLGLDQIALRRIAQDLPRGGAPIPDSAHRVSMHTLVFVTGLNVVAALLAFGILALWAPEGLTAVDHLSVSLAMPAFALIGLLAGQTRGLGYNLLAQVPDAIGIHLVFAALLAAFALTSGVGLTTVLLCLCAAAWIVLLFQALLRVRIGFRFLAFPDLDALTGLVREGITVFQAALFTGLSERAPIFVTSAVLGPAATALMEIAIRFGNVATIITGSVAATLSPRFARHAHEGNRQALLQTLLLGAVMAAVPALGYFCVLVLGASLAIELLLPEAYADAYVPMLWIAGATIINAAFGIANNVLIMAGDGAKVMYFSLGRLLVVAGGGILMAQAFGVIGVCAAIILGTIVRDGSGMLWVRRVWRRA
ncbi:lipopolysaccharide biosynthesis protein [Pyruvatibacter mobilis]|uniref:lipopolysaccharide biosynthesis protein n=1 Tax=Pyruvatibacter mobilis TaxID=1712261 RepID=UPI003BAB6725